MAICACISVWIRNEKILGYEGGDVPVSGLRAPLVPIVSDKNTEYKYKMLKRKIQIK